MLRLPPCPSRIVFIDTEFTTIDKERRQVWEIGGIIREPGRADIEFEWQIRPDLTGADPASVRIARYYERCLVKDQMVGDGVIIVDQDYCDPGDAGVIDYARRITAREIAAQLAPILNGATLIGGVPSADETTLELFLPAHGQILAAEHRLHCVRTMALGYLLGCRAERQAQARETGADPQPFAVPTFPWSPKDLAEAVGVPLPPPGKAHRALVDARWARDVVDALFGGTDLFQSVVTDTTT